MTDPVFFKPTAGATAQRVASAIGASLADASLADVAISHAAPAEGAGAGALIYVDNKRHAVHLAETGASAVICREIHAGLVRRGVAVLVSTQPQSAFAAALRYLYPDAVCLAALSGETGVSPAAHVHPDALIEAGAIVEPGAVIGAGAAVGSGSVIGPHAVIGPGTQIGRDCRVGHSASVQFALLGNRVILHPGVRIGQDGFGYVGTRAGPEKLPQIGRVVIQDDVEIGANSTIDRGALTDTVIGEKTKIDNLVQIAHNVRIGRCCVIAGMCGISGSVTIGSFVRIGGNAGLADHITVGDGAQIAAKAGVMHDIPAGEAWAGAPAQPMKAFFREVVGLRLKSGKAGENGDKGK